MPFSNIALLVAQFLPDHQPLQPPPVLEEDPQISALLSNVAIMQQDIEESAARCLSLEQYLVTLQSESESLLSQDASPAMDALLLLVNHIESLHQITEDQKSTALMAYRNPTAAVETIRVRTPLVSACKSQSRIVFSCFQSLSEKARDLTQKFTNLATDFTFEMSMAQERIDMLRDSVQVAKTLRNGMESQRENWQGQKAVAEAHAEQARATIRSAERKRDSMESARVVRNILTFGLGEAFDLFDLNEEIEDAERMVTSAERNVRACEESTQRAVAALQRITDEVGRLNVLGDTVVAQEMTLQDSVTHGQAVRTRTLNLTNASLDVSLFVGTLAAKSETFAVHHTAQEFATSVLTFGRLMVAEGMFSGLLVQRNPEALQETLQMIAQSGSGQSDLAGDGRSMEAQQQFAIEDMI